MGTGILVSGVAAAGSVGAGALVTGAVAAGGLGLGCGTCCGSGVSTVFTGYLMTHAGSFRGALGGFVRFCMGKILAVVSICIATSIAGSRLLDEEGCIGSIPVMKVVDLCMIAMALWMLYDLWREKSGRKTCAHCEHAGRHRGGQEEIGAGKGPSKPGADRPDPGRKLSGSDPGGKRSGSDPGRKLSGPAAFLMGAGYGITPCAPLILVAGYCASMPLMSAAFVGAVFAAASVVSPMLILLLISGVLAGRMYREIPKYMDWFRAACYFGMIGYFVYSLFVGSSVVA